MVTMMVSLLKLIQWEEHTLFWALECYLLSIIPGRHSRNFPQVSWLLWAGRIDIYQRWQTFAKGCCWRGTELVLDKRNQMTSRISLFTVRYCVCVCVCWGWCFSMNTNYVFKIIISENPESRTYMELSVKNKILSYCLLKEQDNNLLN